METNELIIAAGCILVGIIFFIAASNYMNTQAQKSGQLALQLQSDRLASLIERVASEEFDSSVGANFVLCNVSVRGGVFTIAREDKSASSYVPKNVQDAELDEITTLCVIKTGETVKIEEICPSE